MPDGARPVACPGNRNRGFLSTQGGAWASDPDRYQVHVDDRATPLEETAEALAGLVTEGKIRYVGWSNVRTRRPERVLGLCDRHGGPAPVAVRQQHSYPRPVPGATFLSIVDDEQLDHLRANPRVSLVAYCPILEGSYDGPARPARNGDYAGPDADAALDIKLTDEQLAFLDA